MIKVGAEWGYVPSQRSSRIVLYHRLGLSSSDPMIQFAIFRTSSTLRQASLKHDDQFKATEPASVAPFSDRIQTTVFYCAQQLAMCKFARARHTMT